MLNKETGEGVIVPVEWHIPEDLEARYATNIVVQHSEHEFIVSFFEMQRPVILGPPEEIKAKLKALGSVRAECIARIYVSPGRMQEFIKVLQENLDKYVSKLEQ